MKIYMMHLNTKQTMFGQPPPLDDRSKHNIEALVCDINNMKNYTWTAEKWLHILKTIKSANEPQLILFS